MCHLSEFSNCMIISGYKMKERWITICGSILRMEEMRRKVVRGEIESVNRKKLEIQKKKVEKGGLTSSSWFLKGKTYNVISCQPSPDGILARKVSDTLNSINPSRRILVTEDGGIPITASLRKSDPFRN